MKAFVAVTDKAWFDYQRALSRREPVEEVNFWTPKPWGGRFRALDRGQPLLFKLKRPFNAIVGGGFFEHYTELSISLAWEAFGEKNGAPSLAAVRERTARLRRDRPRPWEDYTIGCILLAEPFFWEEDEWIPQPSDWKPNTQRGAGYDLTAGVGRRLWEEIALRLHRTATPERAAERPPPEIPGGYADPLHQPRRVGQGIFRSVVTDVYHRQCAVTRERALPALDAAHIRPFSVVPENYVQNGLLLRSDVHRLFDAGYVTVTPDYRVEVSGRIRTDFDDGENYEKLHGGRVWVPKDAQLRPRREFLVWHNETKYRG